MIIYSSVFCFFVLFLFFDAPAQERPWAGAVLDLRTASTECDRKDCALVCTDQGRSERETDDTGQAYPDGESGGGRHGPHSDRICGESSDGRESTVRGAYAATWLL